MNDKLSPPLILTGDFDESLNIAFDFFNKALNDRNNRPTLFGKNIFIEAHELINAWPVGFWHIVSLEDKHHFKVLPCSNDSNIDLCEQNCNDGIHQITIKYGAERRNICLLRASRMPWIVDIVKLADQKDPCVDVWFKPSNGKLSGKLYLRYRHSGADYVVIFSAEKKFYRLISAFPVFYVSEKSDFDKDYATYAWSYEG